MARPLTPLMLVAGLVLGSPARAASLDAGYVVFAAGMPVLEMEALLEFRPAGYRLRAMLRTRGPAALVVNGESRLQAEGGWDGGEPRPALYLSDGQWRGRPSRIEMHYVGPQPVLRHLHPPDGPEREPVPEAMRRGTLDALSALAKLAQAARATGRCDGAAAVFDGRRRMEVAMRTAGRDILPPRRGAWSGEALRCTYESRVVAGFRRDQDRDGTARPMRGTVWVAAVHPGAPPIPVRFEIPSRWFGTATGYLMRAAPSAQHAAQ
jgi:hypothetical protein